jgi:hypothetical protein
VATEQEKAALRKRLHDDFDFYSRHALKVRTKNNEVTPFTMNAVQRRFHAEVEDQRLRTGRVRKIILKGRQQGFSTYVSARKYFRLSQRKARKGLVIAHKADSSRALFDMYQRYHTLCPPLLKPITKYSSRKELVFEKLDTGIMVATAGGDGIARGETISDAHLSEIAFWPPDTAEENFNSLYQSIPNADDTEVYEESTANGFNIFKDHWDAAVAGESEFEPFFAAWFETPEYRMPVPEGFERTLEEEDLLATYGHLGLVDDEQLEWRRKKIAANGRMKFMQEYPCCPDEAFIASGRPVFNPDQIVKRLEELEGPLYLLDVDETGAGFVVNTDKSPVGRLAVYHERDVSESYAIGADVGMGIRDGDWSVAHVLDSEKRQVAVFRAQVHPDHFADILAALGRYYNMALIAPERNNHGLVTCIRLHRELSYPNVFLDIKEGQTEEQDTINIGFYTDVKTRPLIIDRLRAAVRDELTVNDRTTLKEMQTFVVNEAGKMQAESKCHDDCVMALAIANHIHPGRFAPIEVPDDYYVNAI